MAELVGGQVVEQGRAVREHQVGGGGDVLRLDRRVLSVQIRPILFDGAVEEEPSRRKAATTNRSAQFWAVNCDTAAEAVGASVVRAVLAR